ncbi:MAG: hypothetical protein Q7K43_00315, partial [Candidatus Woesearchaeota archaeon]|nr:hypothetical protein [Candidatus Woesearchaeota archaeon]
MRGVKTVASWIAGLGILAGIMYDSVSLHKNQKALEQSNANSIASISSDLNTTREQLLSSQQELSLVRQEYGARERELHILAQEHQSSCAGAHEALINELMRDRRLSELEIKAVQQQAHSLSEDARTRESARAKKEVNLERRIVKSEKRGLHHAQVLGLVTDPVREKIVEYTVFVSSAGSGGSGTIVGRKKKGDLWEYTVLSARHVFNDNLIVNETISGLEFKSSVLVRTANGSEYKARSISQ